MAYIDFEDLTFTYPNEKAPALDGVTLGVERGELMLVIGPSGGGKSTLLRHLKTVLAPHGARRGRVLVDGRPLEELSEREQAAKIGFVFQHPDDQIVTDRVWHELAFGLESLGAPRENMRLRAAEMASYFGLDGLFLRATNELSGGQKQLLNLASVMAPEPEILVLDEPTAQLDPIAAADFLSTVKRLNRELGMTVIMCEHRLEEALPMADRVAVLEEGRLTCCLPPRGCAEKLYRAGSEMALALPSAARIGLELGAVPTPVTVNEARSFIARLGKPVNAPAFGDGESSEGEPLIEAKGLYFRYEKDGEDALCGASLTLRRGEVYALVGGNGAGKSSLLSVLSGANAPYRGFVRVNGAKMRGRFSAFEARIGYLRQDPRTVFSHDTVLDDLLESAASRTGERAEERARELARFMGAEELLSRHPYDLSGGEQQRAAIAKIMLTEPEALLLDEPTKGLDAGMKRALGAKLRELAEHGTAVLLVSHDTEFCAEFADRAGFMFRGEITSEALTRSFFCRNTFYTTAANRIARGIAREALLTREVCALYSKTR